MKRNWLPDLHQLSHRKAANPLWLHSVWLGLFYGLIYFPTMLWEWSFKPFVKGLIKAFVSLLSFMVAGLLGRLHSDFDKLEDAYAKGLLRLVEQMDDPESGER